MRKTKIKRGSFWRDQMLPFVVLWAVSVGVVGVISRLWPTPFFAAEDKVILSLLASVILTGVVQVFLVERLLKRSMHGWMLYTIPGAFMTLLLDSVLPSIFFGPSPFLRTIFSNYNLVASLALNVPTSLLQFFWLRRRVQRAWLWPLVTIPLLMAFSMIPYGEEHYQLLKIVTLLSVGVVQAGLMHVFWQHPQEDIHANRDDARMDESDEERLERLQERDQETPTWDRGTDQAFQSDAL